MIAPAAREALVADLAAVFHWPLAELGRLPFSAARRYRRLAIERAQALAGLRSGAAPGELPANRPRS